MPWLKNGDRFTTYLASCIRHVEAQKCDLNISKVFLTEPIARDIRRQKQRITAITEKLNEIADAFLKSSCTHLWILDADIEAPSFALQTLQQLNVDIASGVYPTHSDRNRITGGYMGPPRKHRLLFGYRSQLKGRVLGGGGKWVAGGNGCLLVKRRVFEGGLRFRYKPGLRSSDIQFFLDAQTEGFEARVHEAVLCGHLPEHPLKDGKVLR